MEFKLLINIKISINSANCSSPGRSPGRAIVLPPALALALALASAALAKC